MADEITNDAVPENLDTIRAALDKAPKPEVKVETPPDPPKVEEPVKKAFEPISSQEDFDKKVAERLARQERQLSKQLREERDARIRAEARAEERAALNAPKGETPAPGEPQLKDFDDFSKYAKALARFEAKQVVEESTAESRKALTNQQSQFQQQQKQTAYNKRVEAFMVERPDFIETLSSSTSPLTEAMKAAILESEQGPALAIYLVEHPEEAQRIASNTSEDSKESVARAVRALTLIEAGFAKKPVTKTPEPISPTGARQTSGVKALRDAGSYDEFVKRRRAFIANTR